VSGAILYSGCGAVLRILLRAVRSTLRRTSPGPDLRDHIAHAHAVSSLFPAALLRSGAVRGGGCVFPCGWGLGGGGLSLGPWSNPFQWWATPLSGGRPQLWRVRDALLVIPLGSQPGRSPFHPNMSLFSPGGTLLDCPNAVPDSYRNNLRRFPTPRSQEGVACHQSLDICCGRGSEPPRCFDPPLRSGGSARTTVLETGQSSGLCKR
jgi:hypothetical protein